MNETSCSASWSTKSRATPQPRSRRCGPPARHPESTDAGRHAVAEHKKIDDMFADLAARNMKLKGWLRRFGEAKKLYLHHIREGTRTVCRIGKDTDPCGSSLYAPRLHSAQARGKEQGPRSPEDQAEMTDNPARNCVADVGIPRMRLRHTLRTGPSQAVSCDIPQRHSVTCTPACVDVRRVETTPENPSAAQCAAGGHVHVRGFRGRPRHHVFAGA